MTEVTGRTLPELPAGWRLGHLMERVNSPRNLRTNGGKVWRCNLRPTTDRSGDYELGSSGDGDTPREAVLEAILGIVRNEVAKVEKENQNG